MAEVLRKVPEAKARIRFTRGQGMCLLLLLAGVGTGAALHPAAMLVAMGHLLLAAYVVIVGHKVLAIFAGLLLHDEEEVSAAELARLGPDLPSYTVLVPLYREAEVVGHVVAAVAALDYPPDRLQVLLLIEADDAATLAAAGALSMPGHIAVLAVPRGEPRTKPRACNVGLAAATGELLVVYDAEDRPDPDQLRKAVAVFRRSPPGLGCLQAKLNFYNHGDNLLTRWFTLEYSAWFDLFLPGLHALRCPIPLGGTSNHFRTSALRLAGGWDAYNVTEDCDLGIELARHRIETRVLDSTTWEECPRAVWPWIKQRSRWMKGYGQTFLTHTRRPLVAAAEIGPFRYLQAMAMVGGHLFAMLANSVCWAILAAWLWHPWRLFFPESPWTLIPAVLAAFLGGINVLFLAVHHLAGRRRGMPGAWRPALLMPLYWGLISVGAIRGCLQFLWAPHFWDKTMHGHSHAAASPVASAPVVLAAEGLSVALCPVLARPSIRRRRWPTVLVLGLFLGGCLATTVYLPVHLGYAEQIRRAGISHLGPSTQHAVTVDDGWVDGAVLEMEATLTADAPVGEGLFRFLAFLKVADGEWYQREVEEYTLQGEAVKLRLPLDAAWTGKDTGMPWGPWCLRRVREAGLRVFPEPGFPLRRLRLVGVGATPPGEPPPALSATVLAAPAAIGQWQMVELDFRLSREYRNPFDPEEICLDLLIERPDGTVQSVPAYCHQEYRRELHAGQEVLTAVGAPVWRARFTPEVPGIHRWRLAGTDLQGAMTGEPPAGIVEVAPREARGFLRVDPQDGRFFSFANGDFHYPVCLNIRSPSDDLRLGGCDADYPDAAAGTFAYDDFFAQMADNGIDLGRIWMSPWFGALEWARDVEGYHGMGQYSLQNAWRVDRLLAEAERRNLLVEIALHHHGPFMAPRDGDTQWLDNPHNRANGGELARAAEVLTHPWAWRAARHRLRYLVGRYGAYPSLFAWVLWIEVDAVERDAAIQAAWHREFAPFLRRLDQGRHPVSTEFRSETGTPEVWRIPEIDYVQVAAYTTSTGMLNVLRRRADAMSPYGKPAVIEEYGGSWRGGDKAAVAQELHDGLWAGWMLPVSASPMAWWWNFIFAHGLTRFHATFAEYIRGEDLRGHDDRLERLWLVGASEPMAAMARIGRERAYAWIHHDGVSNASADGQRGKIDAAFRRFANPAHDPLTATAPEIFPPQDGLVLSLPGMADGTYRIEFWETWSPAEPQVVEAACVDGVLAIPLPTLTRDLALKARRLASAP